MCVTSIGDITLAGVLWGLTYACLLRLEWCGGDGGCGGLIGWAFAISNGLTLGVSQLHVPKWSLHFTSCDTGGMQS